MYSLTPAFLTATEFYMGLALTEGSWHIKDSPRARGITVSPFTVPQHHGITLKTKVENLLGTRWVVVDLHHALPVESPTQ